MPVPEGAKVYLRVLLRNIVHSNYLQVLEESEQDEARKSERRSLRSRTQNYINRLHRELRDTHKLDYSKFSQHLSEVKDELDALENEIKSEIDSLQSEVKRVEDVIASEEFEKFEDSVKNQWLECLENTKAYADNFISDAQRKLSVIARIRQSLGW